MIFKGFKFGLLLQMAIGPVCLFIINTAMGAGIIAAEAGVLGVTIVDSIFIALSILGVGAALKRKGIKVFLNFIGSIIMIYFGLGVIMGSFGINIIPSFFVSETSLKLSNTFFASIILTLSNPLTILFWTGVFATKIAGEEYGKSEVIKFGAGAALATVAFLGTVALILGLLHLFISEMFIKVLNLIVGVVLIGFGVKMAFRKEPTSIAASE